MKNNKRKQQSWIEQSQLHLKIWIAFVRRVSGREKNREENENSGAMFMFQEMPCLNICYIFRESYRVIKYNTEKRKITSHSRIKSAFVAVFLRTSFSAFFVYFPRDERKIIFSTFFAVSSSFSYFLHFFCC